MAAVESGNTKSKFEDKDMGIDSNIQNRSSISNGHSIREGDNHQFVHHASDSVVKKDLGWIGILAAGFNVSNSWLVVAATLTISLAYGPMVTIWGVIVVTLIYACIGLTLAELISAYPTTGGQYHWTSILAPNSIKNIASYYCGFISWFSWLAMSASSMGAISLCVFALIFNSHADFEPKPWQSFILYEAVNVLSLLFNLFGKKIISPFYTFGFILSLAAFLVFMITSLTMQKTKQDSKTLWTSYSDFSGWAPGVQFLIALAAPVVAFCPVDGAVHLVEEVNNASRVVPRTVITALVISFVTSLAFVLSVLYCVSDFDSVMATPSGFPLFEIWHQATSTLTVPVVFTVVTIILLPIGSIACCQVASMMTLSLGRDGAFLFSRYLSQVHAGLNVPVWGLLMNFTVIFLIGILYLFSALAFNSIVGVAVILQQITMAVPAALLLYRRRSESVLPLTRSFRLPQWLGWFCNIVTVAFTVITTTFFQFPAATNPDSNTMNYACVVVGGALLVATINWILLARSRYDGPTLVKFHA